MSRRVTLLRACLGDGVRMWWRNWLHHGSRGRDAEGPGGGAELQTAGTPGCAWLTAQGLAQLSSGFRWFPWGEAER